MTYRAMVDSQHKSPLKKRRMQNSSDAIQQEVSHGPLRAAMSSWLKPFKLKRLALLLCFFFSPHSSWICERATLRWSHS